MPFYLHLWVGPKNCRGRWGEKGQRQNKSQLLLAKNILRRGERVKGCGHDRDLCESVLAREALRGKGCIVGLGGGEVGWWGGGERVAEREEYRFRRCRILSV